MTMMTMTDDDDDDDHTEYRSGRNLRDARLMPVALSVQGFPFPFFTMPNAKKATKATKAMKATAAPAPAMKAMKAMKAIIQKLTLNTYRRFMFWSALN